mgnify:FL=1
MSVRNAGKAIREARIKAGLTQEKLSDGICSTLSLSRIENCTAGVSPSTFHALMSRAGAECEAFPTFASRTDFDCFYTLKRARFYLEAWQFEDAYHQLMSVQDMNWADNRFYYQEWLLLQYRIQFHNHSQEHEYLYDLLTEAFLISYPEFNIDMINSLLLSTVELEILIGLAQECYYLGQTDRCGYLCAQIESYLQNIQFTTLEKEHFLAQNAIVYTKYLLAQKDYVKALEVADKNRHQMVINNDSPFLYELTFLTGLCYYHNSDIEKFYSLFLASFYASHAINSCYATTIIQYVKEVLHYPLHTDVLSFNQIPYGFYPVNLIENVSLLHDGIYDTDSFSIIYIGDIIRELRMEQKLSQQTLCQGLCSKSKLSKIENNYLQPNISLAEALLQRLGLCERVFTFWGTKQENDFHEIKFKLIQNWRPEAKHAINDFDVLISCVDKKNPIQLQYCLYEKALIEKNPDIRIILLVDALRITLPDFSFSHINDYRYSWVEFSLINSICWAYSNSNSPYLGIRYYYFVLEYIQHSNTDILLQDTLFPVTIAFFTNALYSANNYDELLDLIKDYEAPYMKQALPNLGISFFYYCQSLGECDSKHKAIRYANYACALNELLELQKNSYLLKKYLYDDFGITLN